MAKDQKAKNSKNQVTPKLEIKAEHQVLTGKYCNFALIQHSRNEFIYNFILTIEQQSQLVSRIITSPSHAKAILKALQQNIEKYEKTYGKITD